MKIIGVKIGSALLVNGQQEINQPFIGKLSKQVGQLLDEGYGVFIVSSGAVASCPQKKLSKQLRAAIGMPKLMEYYRLHFRNYRQPYEVAQLLVTDQEIIGARREVLKNFLLESLDKKIVPIINANDPIDDAELKALEYSADNDQLFGSVCELLGAELAIIVFDQPGLIAPDGSIIHYAQANDFNLIASYAKNGNPLGHGQDGMKTKMKVLANLASQGIRTRLAPGQENNFLLRAVRGEKNFGTVFIATFKQNQSPSPLQI